MLVDATDFLLRDTVDRRDAARGAAGRLAARTPARSALHFERSGAFPRNTELEATLTFASENPRRAVAAVLPDGRTHEPARPPLVPEAARAGLHAAPARSRASASSPSAASITPRPSPSRSSATSSTRWRLEKKDPGRAALGARQADRLLPGPRHARARARRGARSGAVVEPRLRGGRLQERVRRARPARSGRRSSTCATRASSGSTAPSGPGRSASSSTDPRTGEILHAVARIDSHRRRTTSRIWRNLARPGAACTRGRLARPRLAGGRRRRLRFGGRPGARQRLRYLSAHEVGSHARPAAQLGGDHVRLGLGHGLPRPEHRA